MVKVVHCFNQISTVFVFFHKQITIENDVCSEWHRHTWKKEIRVLLSGVEPKIFWLLVWVRHYWATGDSWELRPLFKNLATRSALHQGLCCLRQFLCKFYSTVQMWELTVPRNSNFDPRNLKASSIQARVECIEYRVECIEFRGRETNNFSRD